MTCEEDIFCGINKAKNDDVEAMTDLEKKHTPVINAPSTVKKGVPFEVTIEVGKYMAHPNENAHFIEWLELYSGKTFLTRVDLVPHLATPTVKLHVSLDHAHALIARTRCNLHGTWESSPSEIEIE
jgi:superoxide reductase